MAWLDCGSKVSAQPQVLVVEDDTRIAAALLRATLAPVEED